jgi:NHLM bacteriocin system ABC transporter ATP-binding protein
VGVFGKQLERRAQNDDALFFDSIEKLARAVAGGARPGGEKARIKSAVGEILRHYGMAVPEHPSDMDDLDEQLEYMLRQSGAAARNVKLTRRWHKDAHGPMLGFTVEGEAVALIPGAFGGYSYFDRPAGRRRRVTRKTAGRLSEHALCFYKPLPARVLTFGDLAKYAAGCFSAADVLTFTGAAFAAALIGLITPFAVRAVFAALNLTGGVSPILWAAASLLAGASLSSALIGSAREIIMSRITSKLSVSVQAAVMLRAYSMPAPFFRRHAPGEAAELVRGVGAACAALSANILTACLGLLFALPYAWQISVYAPPLAAPSVIAVSVGGAVAAAGAFGQARIAKIASRSRAKLSGLVFALLNGVKKVKTSGAERRAFAKWAYQYAEYAKPIYNPPLVVRLAVPAAMLAADAGAAVLFLKAAESGVSIADYMAFSAAFGVLNGAFFRLSDFARALAQLIPEIALVKPVFASAPEDAGGKPAVTKLSGAVEFSHVSFGYGGGLILDDLSLKIKAGQYAAIVGETGCGKSTAFRLLLGFEKPLKGAVYYDGRDLSSIDAQSLRRKLGVVMQDGKLFKGDIFSNIIVAAPWLGMDDAWAAAETAGIAGDIRAMPMGMRTVIAEGSGGISGGQRQRIMIARAVAAKPKILLFDEATSALDNISQKKVADALAGLKCTRIVIAHRITTVMNCDRIFVIDGGRVAEEGDYAGLIAKGGLFARFAERQMSGLS